MNKQIQKIVEDFNFNAVKSKSFNLLDAIDIDNTMEAFKHDFVSYAFNFDFFNAFCGYNHQIFNYNPDTYSLTVGYTRGDCMCFDLKFLPGQKVDMSYYVVLIMNADVIEYFNNKTSKNKSHLFINSIYTPYVSFDVYSVTLFDIETINNIPDIHTEYITMDTLSFSNYEVFDAFYEKFVKTNPKIKFYVSNSQAKHALFRSRLNPQSKESRTKIRENYEFVNEGSKIIIRKK